MRSGTGFGCRIGLGVALPLICSLALAAAAPASPKLPSPASQANLAYAPGEAIVRFERGTTGADRVDARTGAEVEFEAKLTLPRVEVVEVEGGVPAAIARLEDRPEVEYAQPNYRYEALAVTAPNDTFFGQLWGLSDPALPDPGIGALEAWEHGLGGGQVIAVVDTGVDLTHPDLEPNLWTNPIESIGLPGVDEDLNGEADDVHGYDFVDADGNPDDYEFHGTHVAGTAAAVAGNDDGIAGVAPEAEIMAVRVLDGNGSGFTSDIADGIAYAAEAGADVINLSLGGPAGGDQATEDAIELAGAEEAVVVAAAGNDAADNDTEPHTPCALPQPNLICVAALNQAGALAGFSNFGAQSVDLAAPGSGILSAKTDYGAPVFGSGFESGLSGWSTAAANGGLPWGAGAPAASGAASATDSPGGDYGQGPQGSEVLAASELFTATPVDLTAEHGCRVHFQTMYEIEERAAGGAFFDAFAAGAVGEGGGTPAALRYFAGESSGYPADFEREEVSVSDLDGRDDVHPIFGILSDESLEFDGAYVDDVRLICRDDTYVDAISSVAQYDEPNAGNYVRFSGTSMAAPHVAGVVALVRAAAPGLSAQEAVDAVLTGVSATPSPSPGRQTATGGIADACKAIAVATAGDFAADCPGSTESAPIDQEGTVPPAIPVDPATQTPVPGAPPPSVGVQPRPAEADRSRPRTFFRKRPPRVVYIRGRKSRIVFRLAADEAGVSYVCRIDGGPFRRCGRRFVRRFGLGRHVVRVVARDAAGNVDRSPAVHRFRVKRRRG